MNDPAPPPYGRWLVAVSLVLLVLLLGTLPATPKNALAVLTVQPEFPLAAVAYQGATNHTGQSVYAMEIRFSEPLPIVPLDIYCSSSSNCQYSIATAWSNVSSPLHSLGSGWSVASAVTWINGTEACGVTRCPSTNISCDNSSVRYHYPDPTLSVPVPCYHLAMLWNGTTFYAPEGLQKINYTVTRLAVYLDAQPDHWTATGTGGTAKASTVSVTVTAPSSTYWTSGPVANWSVPAVAWVVPYPKGTWDATQTIVTPVPGNAALPFTQYQSFSRYVLMEWTGGFPYQLQANDSLSYTIGLTTTGGKTQTVAQNLSNATLPPLTSNLPQVVNVGIGNVTGLGNGESQASTDWFNGYTQDFNGSFELAGPWIPMATGLSLTENGVKLGPAQYYDAGSYLVVNAGVLSVANATSVSFQATYTEGSSYGFATTLFTVNGVAVNTISLVLLGGVVALAGLIILGVTKHLPGDLAENALGTTAFVLILVAWMVSP